jgi:biopolymer transport protein ExbD
MTCATVMLVALALFLVRRLFAAYDLMQDQLASEASAASPVEASTDA